MQVRLLKYGDKRFISLKKYLDEVGAHCTVESLHKLRLEIKKLYALYGIIGDKEWIPVLVKELKILDHIYSNSGILRDNHVRMELLNKYRLRVDKEADFIAKLLKNDNEKYKEIVRHKIKNINPFDLVLLNQKFDNAIEVLSNSTIDKGLQNKVNELFDKIRLIDKNKPDEKALHRVRIKLKELIYTLSIIKKGSINSKFDLTIITYLKNLQFRLGEWHDLKVLIDYVNRIKGESAKKLIRVIEFDKQTKLIVVLAELHQFEEMCANEKKKGNLELPIFYSKSKL